MSRSILVLLLAALMTVATAQDKAPGFVIVEVKASSYLVAESEAQSLDRVIADLRAIRKLDGVGIVAGQGGTQERVDGLIEAIRKSGLKVRIALVRNELFTQ